MSVENQTGEPSYLTAGEAARRLHVSPKTVNRWAAAGWLTCEVTLGGHRRFPVSEVERVRRQMAKV